MCLQNKPHAQILVNVRKMKTFELTLAQIPISEDIAVTLKNFILWLNEDFQVSAIKPLSFNE
jgi:hypothetical protein